jgi:Tfp pilus assembly protein FimT
MPGVRNWTRRRTHGSYAVGVYLIELLVVLAVKAVLVGLRRRW